MNKLPLHIIVATDRYGNIGYQNTIPWKLEGDLKHFKEKTLGQVVVMGRKTLESLPKPLAGRTVLVVSSTLLEEVLDGRCAMPTGVAAVVTSLNNALEYVEDVRNASVTVDPTTATAIAVANRVYVAGGAGLYREAWDIADYLDLTLVINRKNVEYDTAISGFNVRNWELEYPAVKVETLLEGHVIRSISHIQYRAKAVKAGTKTPSTERRFALEWIFDNALGHREMFDEVIRPGCITEDDVVEEIATALANSFIRRFDPAPSSKELVTMLDTATDKAPESERDYFNVWTSTVPTSHNAEGRVLAVLANAVTDLNTPGKIKRLASFINQVRSELELCLVPNAEGVMMFPEHLHRFDKDDVHNSVGSTTLGQGVAPPENGSVITADPRPVLLMSEHMGENLIASTRTRMTDAAVEVLLKKAADEQKRT